MLFLLNEVAVDYRSIVDDLNLTLRFFFQLILIFIVCEIQTSPVMSTVK